MLLLKFKRALTTTVLYGTKPDIRYSEILGRMCI